MDQNAKLTTPWIKTILCTIRRHWWHSFVHRALYFSQSRQCLHLIVHHEEHARSLSTVWENPITSDNQRWLPSEQLGDIERNSIILRIGLALGMDGGAISQMLLPFSFGLGGKISTGIFVGIFGFSCEVID